MDNLDNQAIVKRPAAALLFVLAMVVVVPAWAQEPVPREAPVPASDTATSPAPADPAQGQPASAATQQATPEAPPASPSDPVESEFDELDRDGDGKVSASEHAAGAKAKFDAMDADHDYHVSAQEAAREDGGASIAQQISSVDKIDPVDNNNNGEISNEESRVDAEKAFSARDANRDGSLSLDEMRGNDTPAAPPEDDDY